MPLPGGNRLPRASSSLSFSIAARRTRSAAKRYLKRSPPLGRLSLPRWESNPSLAQAVSPWLFCSELRPGGPLRSRLGDARREHVLTARPHGIWLDIRLRGLVYILEGRWVSTRAGEPARACLRHRNAGAQDCALSARLHPRSRCVCACARASSHIWSRARGVVLADIAARQDAPSLNKVAARPTRPSSSRLEKDSRLAAASFPRWESNPVLAQPAPTGPPKQIAATRPLAAATHPQGPAGVCH